MRRPLEDPIRVRRGDGRESGFTLVEALVAIVVLIFGLMAVTNLMLVAASSNSVGNQGTVAATIEAVEATRKSLEQKIDDLVVHVHAAIGQPGAMIFEDLYQCRAEQRRSRDACQLFRRSNGTGLGAVGRA